MASFRVPSLSNSNTIIRLAEDPAEIAATNRLVCNNYVSAKYWENDAKNMQNQFLHTPSRKIVVALEEGQLVGTISLILDSSMGLPSEGAQAQRIDRLRMEGGVLAEISGFAVDRSKNRQRTLALFLMSYVLQHSYYYAGVDRLVASSTAPHARFYETVIGFSIIKSGPTLYADTHIAPYFYLMSLDLNAMHSGLEVMVPGDAYRRFMFSDPQPCHQFPPTTMLKRPRQINSLKKSAEHWQEVA